MKRNKLNIQRMNNNIGQFKLKNTLNYRKSNYCALYFSRKIFADKYSLDGIITYFPLIKCDSVQFSAAFNYLLYHSPLVFVPPHRSNINIYFFFVECVCDPLSCVKHFPFKLHAHTHTPTHSLTQYHICRCRNTLTHL